MTRRLDAVTAVTRVTAVTASSRRVMAAMAGSPPFPLAARALRQPYCPSGAIEPDRAAGCRGDDPHGRVTGQVGRGRRQRDVDGTVGGQDPAADRARLARSRDGGEQRLDGRPEGQVDERGQRLARRVPGRRPEQRRRLVVGPPDRPVLFEQEQRDGVCWNTACSSRRSVRTASGSTSFGGMSALAADPGAAAPSASMAASSSMSAASISVRGSAPEAESKGTAQFRSRKLLGT